MKAVFRNNLFETNSSSSHALIIKKQPDLYYDDLKIDDDGYVHTEFGEFGWGVDMYYDSRTKLSYAVTMVASTEKYGSEDGFYETDGMKGIIDLLTKKIPGCDGVIVDDPRFEIESYTNYRNDPVLYMDFNGYIDHQSCGYASLQDFLDDWGIDLERFIFDDNVGLLIDNDNH